MQGICCAHHSQKTQNWVGQLSQIWGLLPKSARVSWLPSQTSSGLSYLRDSGHFLEEIEGVGGNFVNALLVAVDVVGLHPGNQGRF